MVVAVEKRYQVFVSSTFTDMTEERAEVMQALLELKCFPAGMELFPAANDTQWTWIKRVIDESDYYLVIIGGRYGTRHAELRMSYTEMEYRYALERGKPTMGFLHADLDSLPRHRCDMDPKDVQSLNEFRALVQQKLCRFYRTPQDLGAVVSRSITQMKDYEPAAGWVRASLLENAPDPSELLALRDEIEKLKKQNQELRTQLGYERITFEQAGEKYLEEIKARVGTAADAKQHLKALMPFIGHLRLDEVNEQTLQPFVAVRRERDQVSWQTIKLAKGLVYRILRLAALRWRHADGRPLLERIPVIEIDKELGREDRRAPHELSMDEQEALLESLPAEPQRQMALFILNTGTRNREVCRLRWAWEQSVSGIYMSVFLIPQPPPKAPRIVVLNDVAEAIIKARRGIHPEFVFTYAHGRQGDHHDMSTMNNSSWQAGRLRAAKTYEERHQRRAPDAFRRVRVEDLKYTVERRLAAAGIKKSLQQTLLGRRLRDAETLYSPEEILELRAAADVLAIGRA